MSQLPVAGRAPVWFTAALAHTPEDHTIEVAGCRVHYLAWGEPGRPGVVLVHGGAAHAHWWSFLAPMLLPTHRIVALDLSGHGDSGRRPEYPRETWAEEIMAVIDDGRTAPCPVVVGHSMGGFVTIVAAATAGDRLGGAVIVDSPVRRPEPEAEEGARGTAFRNPKTYPDPAVALEHFRVVPEQPCDNGWIIDYIARHSLKRTEAGWTWKFDPVIFQRFMPRAIHEFLPDLRCPVAIMRGQLSDVVTPDVHAYMAEMVEPGTPIIEIPQAHHHVMLDQPLAFIAALRAVLAFWTKP